MTDRPKKITSEVAAKIIDRKTPKGLFFVQKSDIFIAIYNTEKELLKNEFNDKESCLNWLTQEKAK